jgi:ADP-heptose:LPS heptosyltransferase
MKILIRLPNWLGDVVMSTAFIAAVRQLYPNASLDIIIKKELGGIAGLIPGLRTVHLFSKQDFKGIKGAYRFGKKLRHERYDLFFNLPTSLSSLVIARASGAKKRIGFANEGGFFMLTNAYKNPGKIHRVEQYLQLLTWFSGKTIKSPRVELYNPTPPIRNNNRVIINYNSEAKSRRMPHEKGLALINQLTTAFKNTTFTFVGSPKEAPFVDQITARAEIAIGLKTLPGKPVSVG